VFANDIDFDFDKQHWNRILYSQTKSDDICLPGHDNIEVFHNKALSTDDQQVSNAESIISRTLISQYILNVARLLVRYQPRNFAYSFKSLNFEYVQSGQAQNIGVDSEHDRTTVHSTPSNNEESIDHHQDKEDTTANSYPSIEDTTIHPDSINNEDEQSVDSFSNVAQENCLLNHSISDERKDLYISVHNRLIRRELNKQSAQKECGQTWTTIKRIFKILGLPDIKKKPGPVACRTKTQLKTALDYYEKDLGMKISPKHLSEMVVSEGEKPPLRLCRELLSERKETPKTKVAVENPNMFEAHFIDSIWHADLHFPVCIDEKTLIEHREIVIGIIDDKSRYLLCFNFLPDKTAESCANALIDTIEIYGIPKFLTTDNGQEFTGRVFQIVLNFFQILPWRSKPRTPEQNGKIERVWQTLENARGTDRTKEGFKRIVDFYNSTWKHSSNNMTPLKSRQVFAHYTRFETSNNIQENIRYLKKKKSN
jgi:hypothetical protein